MFKVGDTVRVKVRTDMSDYPYGFVCKVIKVYTDWYSTFHVDRINTDLDARGSRTNGWGAENFELVERKKQKNLPAWW
jgi:hypothetical protein